MGRQRTPEVRERLLRAAAEVFLERGYVGATIQEIVRRAGLSSGAVYGNFRNKSDLLCAAIELELGAITRGLERDRAAGVPAADRWRQLGVGLAGEGGLWYRRLLLEALTAARRDHEATAQVQHLLREVEQAISQLIAAAQTEGSMDPALDLPAVARFGLALSTGFDDLVAAGLDAPDADAWAEIMRRVVACFAPSGRPIAAAAT